MSENPIALPRARSDGFSPIRRAFFLARLAEGAVVTAAARHVGVSPPTAYGWRNRDEYFAAGWEAALELARQPLADALYERAVLGVTAHMRRDADTGEIVKEGHDNRLAMQVLTRLDARRRAAGWAFKTGEAYHHWQHLIPVWATFLDAVAIDDRELARTCLSSSDTEERFEAVHSTRPALVETHSLAEAEARIAAFTASEERDDPPLNL
ncbi:hypothetical protein [Sphingomicrobium sediminis]|uniref:Uncharacterized protein n=1 Tax=Sphingomicrobium sediminis TaxID=2950949 RepID=A0A9X2EEE4_9SPHN|nr:hypothetical protein [Sphingomicrobium sediminis]MCM8556440.1 hypothetical protein [Sphingomicrobium sediminis]